ncbi:MAG: hypothetical protein WBQ34_09210 [Candidatus Acidiferrales bacterium]
MSAIVVPLLTLALIAVAAERTHIQPRFRPGETLYYQIETHTASTGKTTTPIINPEGGTKFSEDVDLLARLDVLPEGNSTGGAKSQQGGEQAPVNMRVTYERAHADSQADAPAFDAPSAAREYDRLAGHSFEFTLGPGGAITNLKDIDNTLQNAEGAAPAALSWMRMLETSNTFPQRGISVGQRWTGESPLDGAPLAGLVWHADSTYLRDEPCKAPAAENAATSGAARHAGQCAVIITQFEILHHGSSHADQTPPDYVRHGLRTTGTLTGTGESLDSISLSSGVLVSSTQTSTQRADFDIIDAANGAKIHRDGQVQTQTVITRVAAPPAPAVAQP